MPLSDPRGSSPAANYISPVGRLAGITSAEETDIGSLQIANTRRVQLSPTAGGNQVHIYNNGLPPASPPIRRLRRPQETS
jgi:hypothetical protein